MKQYHDEGCYVIILTKSSSLDTKRTTKESWIHSNQMWLARHENAQPQLSKTNINLRHARNDYKLMSTLQTLFRTRPWTTRSESCFLRKSPSCIYRSINSNISSTLISPSFTISVSGMTLSSCFSWFGTKEAISVHLPTLQISNDYSTNNIPPLRSIIDKEDNEQGIDDTTIANLIYTK